jgi:hypothetical protein
MTDAEFSSTDIAAFTNNGFPLEELPFGRAAG